jgi:hypothetical protein
MTDDRADAETRLESPEVATRTVLFVAVALLVFVVGSIAGGRAYFVSKLDGPVNVPPQTFEKPRLQINDAADLAKFQKEQRAELNGYAWIDRDRGIIRIPIERAMALIAAKGTGAYDAIESAPPVGPSKTGKPP